LQKLEIKNATDFDMLVVGAGTAGMESSLTLGDMGYKVLLVEKAASIGGKTILLSKVFPTLDCASCISTPKMAAAAHHPNVELMVYSEVDAITRKPDGGFEVELHRNPTFVNPAACTGCAQCETVCTVAIPDEYNYGMVARRAAYIAFPQAVPKKSVIDRTGSAPCLHTCPAGVSPSGFVSLVRAGKYEEAFKLHLDEAPLVGSLARACYAPCEGECTRGEMDGPVQIRAIKRFMADRYYEKHLEPDYGPPETLLKTKVAIVGSGPAGLTAAYHLAKKGHSVTVFESAMEPGGMLRYGIPSYRLPNAVLDRDIKNITALGVTIRTNSKVESIQSLKNQGFDAIFVGVGGQVPRLIELACGESLDVDNCWQFLKESKTGTRPEIKGRDVVVIGGGNVALDSARSALRLGAKSVRLLYRRTETEMPAHAEEIKEAREEGVEFEFLCAPVEGTTDDVITRGLRCIRMEMGEVDDSGRCSPLPIHGSGFDFPCDMVILAIGLTPSTAPFASELVLNPGGTLQIDAETTRTSVECVFAGGEAATGPSDITRTMGMGKRAAFYIDRYLKGEQIDNVVFDERLPMTDKKEVLERSKNVSRRDPTALGETVPHERVKSFDPYQGCLTEGAARDEANRCLDCAGCAQCRQCIQVCPADAINFDMRSEHMKVRVDSVILSSGFNISDPAEKPAMGYGRFPNVITAPQMDRLLAPTRPFNGVIRPSDGKEPENIAMVMCMGSRDHTVCNPLCCRIGCMYALKHAQLVMGALPMADVTVYYIDIRAFGKGYEEFFTQSKGMGITFVKGKVARIRETVDGDLELDYEEMSGRGGRQTAQHDMVILSVGLVPNKSTSGLFRGGDLLLDPFAYPDEIEEDINPAKTNIAGVFVAGTVSGSRDIPDTVLHAGAAASQAAAYVERMRRMTGLLTKMGGAVNA
jgi:heterodisulfide reductase subunit A-like polyferredoxin